MSRRKRRSKIYIVSVGLHLALGAAIAFIPKEKLHDIIPISMLETAKPEEKKPPPPPKHEPVEQRPARQAPSHARQAVATATEAKAPVFTDIGIALDSSAVGGIAIAMAPRETAPLPTPSVVKRERPKVLQAKQSFVCSEDVVKAKLLQIVQPEYSAEARAHRTEGRVRLELFVDEAGTVQSVKVLSGLGFGLDEAAIRAARRMRLSPATRCGRPVSAPFVLAMRFVLGS